MAPSPEMIEATRQSAALWTHWDRDDREGIHAVLDEAAREGRDAEHLIREQHGPDCPDHKFWVTLAGLLEHELLNAELVPHVNIPAGGSWECACLDCCDTDAVQAARTYLEAQGVPACASS